MLKKYLIPSLGMAALSCTASVAADDELNGGWMRSKGAETLELISVSGFFEALAEKTHNLVAGLQAKARAAGIPLTANQAGAMFGIFFTGAEKVENFAQATACNLPQFQAFFHAMLRQGVYLAPSAFEAGFVSSAHSDEDLEATIEAAGKAFAELE